MHNQTFLNRGAALLVYIGIKKPSVCARQLLLLPEVFSHLLMMPMWWRLESEGCFIKGDLSGFISTANGVVVVVVDGDEERRQDPATTVYGVSESHSRVFL